MLAVTRPRWTVVRVIHCRDNGRRVTRCTTIGGHTHKRRRFVRFFLFSKLLKEIRRGRLNRFVKRF